MSLFGRLEQVRQQLQNTHKRLAAFIRQTVREKYGDEVADAIRILYGGSVTPETAEELIAQADIDGFLVGGASNDAESIQAIIKAAAKQGPTDGRIPYIGGNHKTKKIARNFYDVISEFLRGIDQSRVQVGFAPSPGLISEFADALVVAATADADDALVALAGATEVEVPAGFAGVLGRHFLKTKKIEVLSVKRER